MVYSTSINDVGPAGPIYPGEAIHLLKGLAEDTGTRYFAALADWRFPLSRQQMNQQLLTEWALNLFKDEGKTVDLGWPWPDREAKPVVSAEEMVGYRAELAASSAFGQIRAQAAIE